jgi:hypothetical protein
LNRQAHKGRQVIQKAAKDSRIGLGSIEKTLAYFAAWRLSNQPSATHVIKKKKRPAARWPFFYSGCFAMLLESDQPHTDFSPLFRASNFSLRRRKR